MSNIKIESYVCRKMETKNNHVKGLGVVLNQLKMQFLKFSLETVCVKGKKKSIPITGLDRPLGCRRLRLPDF
jgi:hypothetical protein